MQRPFLFHDFNFSNLKSAFLKNLFYCLLEHVLHSALVRSRVILRGCRNYLLRKVLLVVQVQGVFIITVMT